MKEGEILLDGPKDDVITPEALKSIYDMDINIECIFGQQMRVYFDDEKTVDDYVREVQMV